MFFVPSLVRLSASLCVVVKKVVVVVSNSVSFASIATIALKKLQVVFQCQKMFFNARDAIGAGDGWSLFYNPKDLKELRHKFYIFSASSTVSLHQSLKRSIMVSG